MLRNPIRSAKRSPVRSPAKPVGGLTIPRQGLVFLSRDGVTDSIGESSGPVQPGQSLYFSGTQYLSIPTTELPGEFVISWWQSADLSKFVGSPQVFGSSVDNSYVGFDSAALYKPTLSLVGSGAISWEGDDYSGAFYKLTRSADNTVSLYIDNISRGAKTLSGKLTLNRVARGFYGNFFGGALWDLRIYSEGKLVFYLPGTEGKDNLIPAFPHQVSVVGPLDSLYKKHYDGVVGYDANLAGFTDGSNTIKPAGIHHPDRNGDNYLQLLRAIDLFNTGWIGGTPSGDHAQNGTCTLLLNTASQDVAVSAEKSISTRFDTGDYWVLAGWCSDVSDINLRITFQNIDGSSKTVYTTDETLEHWDTAGIVWCDITRWDNLADTNWTWGSSVVEKIKIEIWGKPGVDFFFDILSKNSAARPKVVFTFDDGNESDYYAYQYLQSHGFRGTSFINGSTIDNSVPGKLSLSQMNEMYVNGWELSNHTYNHADLTGLTLQEQISEISDGSNWLVENGFIERADYIAYPFGKLNSDTVAAMEQLAVQSGRKTNIQYVDTATGTKNKFETGVTLYFGADLTLAAAKAKIDDIVSRGQTAITMIHKLVSASPAVGDWLKSDFEALVDYIAAYAADNRLDVVPYGKWFDGLSNGSPQLYDISGGILQYPGRIKYNLEIISGTSPSDWIVKLPQAPELISTLGLNSIYYDLTGVPKSIAYTTLMAQEGPLTFGSEERKCWAVYETDRTGTDLLRANKYFNVGA